MEIYLIGYSGHSYVVIESAMAANIKINSYFEKEEKKYNPYGLKFLGPEEQIKGQADYLETHFFVSIGSNQVRANISKGLSRYQFVNIIDPSANVSRTAKLMEGIYVGKNACINAQSCIGTGSIVNTGSIVEHECQIGEFVHIAPGAVLCGNVKIGNNSFIGANSVIKPGILIGENVTIGAGSVVVKNIPDNAVAYGNPAKKIT